MSRWGKRDADRKRPPVSSRAARRGPRHAPRMPFAVLVVSLVVGGLCTLLALNTASAANELRRHDLATIDQNVADQVVQLHNEVAASAAPANLASAAAQLGMVADDNPAFLQIEADNHVRVLGSPVAATAPPTPTPTKPSHPKKTASKTSKKTAKKTSKKTAKKTTKQSPKKGVTKDGKTGATKDGKTKNGTPGTTGRHRHRAGGNAGADGHPTGQPAGTPTSTLPGGPR
jgi:hypothetical protein